MGPPPTTDRQAGRQAAAAADAMAVVWAQAAAASVAGSQKLPLGEGKHTHTHAHNNLQFIVQLHIYINYCRRGFLFLALIN